MALDPVQVLKKHFGYSGFLANQKGVVQAILQGRDVLAVMPTGAGKSICYQVPALAMDGMAVVVSPLISLMKDQVNALNLAGVPAAYLNSTLVAAEQYQVMRQAEEGRVKLLYVAPERLLAPSFIELCRQHTPSMVAVDEAHCISQWGQDFRPSYTKINEFLDSLTARPPVCAFTATATAQVRDDIARCLSLRDPYTVVASFDRPNLRFEVRKPKSKNAALLGLCLKYGSVADYEGDAADGAAQHKGSSGIVYCTSRRAVEEVCDFLRKNKVPATRYHAGLSAEERQKNQDDFLFDRKLVMVATNAFGMGIDKSNVAYVIHYNMPLDLESYYQEAGRAGRDGEPAICTLLYAPKDVNTAEFLINNGYEETADIDGPTRHELLARARERLRQMTFYSTTSECLRRFILRYFGEAAPTMCGNCSNCSTKFEDRDVTVDAQKIISCVYRLAQRERNLGRAAIVDILRGSKAQKILDGGYDTLSTYGIMKDSSVRHVRFVLDRLIEEGKLAVSTGEYAVVLPCAASMAFLKNKEEFHIKVPVEDKEEKRRGKRAKVRSAAGGSYGSSGSAAGAGSADAGDDGLDAQLFAKLKELRSGIAAEENVPAYIVFTNHSLHDMCRKKPRTLQDFLDVSGVGEAKAAKYGTEFLACIAQHEGWE